MEMANQVPITVIILTHNEASNIRACLESAMDIAYEVFVVDSGSTDDTVRIAQEYGVNVVHHPFENYGKQRNWALESLPVKTEWVFNLDADHRVTPELVVELKDMFSKPIDADINGFLTSRRSIFMGKWIRYGGHYPTYHSILFRKGKGRCEDKLYDQHFVVEGKVVKLKSDVIDIMTESISSFTQRHNRWAELEAEDQFFKRSESSNVLIRASASGNPIQRRRYIKSVYERFPLFVRPFTYFIIRYFFRLGFLDGTKGLIFHFLQGFWFRFLIDAKIYELRQKHSVGEITLRLAQGDGVQDDARHVQDDSRVQDDAPVNQP